MHHSKIRPTLLLKLSSCNISIKRVLEENMRTGMYYGNSKTQ